jgi:gliding motility-associated-like protein/uncharacterized repeat protein (TIGR01451 family)
MQWGDLMGINDACGNPISYKQEMIEVVRGLVAYSTRFPTENPRRSNSGIIGFDGYPKGGDTWNEQTDWANNNPFQRDGAEIIPEFGGPRDQHIDYNAPSYFRQFREMLNALAPDAWEEEQFRRGEASSDWLMGKMLDAGASIIPIAGWVEVEGGTANTPVYKSFSDGEDFRAPWRTILNYVWHGNPTYSWDPVNHSVIAGGNTYEKDIATRFVKFLNEPQAAPWSNTCKTFGGGPEISYRGPLTLSYYYTPQGVEQSTFNLNWLQGTGVFTSIATQDFDLMGLMYRQCNIEWEPSGGSDNYLGSTPRYFHGWFRLMGMLAASGNYHAPSEMKPAANMKIYRAIKDSITFAFTGDELTYLLDYRNYGSVDANDVIIVEKVPEDFSFVSATGGGVYDAGSHTVTWNLGVVPGFKSGALESTKGQVSYKIKVGDNASGRYCTTAEITCSNGKGWVSNEYPNYITATMQRNCVDIVARALQVEKTVNRRLVNDGNMATFTINFENSAEAGWIDGGRPRVNVAFAHSGLANPAAGSQHWLKVRLYNDAIESYINYGNYRISYYVHDAGLNCYADAAGCGTGWRVDNAIYEGGDKTGVKISHENIVEGTDATGKWNQRLIVQFAPLLVTTTAHLSNYFGMGIRIHKGGTEPMRGAWRMYPSDWTTVDYSNDWSWDATAQDADDGLYYPVSPSWQDINDPGVPVTSWLPCACETTNKVIENILVEEYDGYVWRRILGTGPMPGRDIENVVVKDTLPVGLKFEEFVNNCPLEEFGASWNTTTLADGRDVITWTIPKLQVKQKGQIIYSATANFPSGNSCETADEDIINSAWISGDKESAISDTAKITVTCAKVPEPVEPTTLLKTADKDTYTVGEPITYTIEYEQTHGSIVEDATALNSDWRLNQWSLSGGNLTSGSTQTGTALFDYAYGKNGYMEFTCNPAVYAAYQVLLRESSGSTIALVIKPLSTSQMELSCYAGGTQVQAAQNITYGGGNPFTMRIDLFDDLLRVWVNKDTTNAPIFSVEGLPEGVGYAGFKNGNMTGGDAHGAHGFTNIHTHFDYAYNLSIIDRKPEEITFINADNNGTLEADSIVWHLVSGKQNPIPFGEKFTVSWDGTVDACDESIVNIAYAKLMGHADNAIMAQAVSECGESETTCNLSSASLSLDAAVICSGDSTIVRVLADNNGTYLYDYYHDGVLLLSGDEADTLVVKTAGSYYAKVYDKSDPTCFVISDTIDLVVDLLPVIELGEDLSVCEGETVTLDAGLSADSYLWSTGATTRSIDITAGGTYHVTVNVGTCTVSDTIQVSFGSVSLPGDGFKLDGQLVSNRLDSICANTTAELVTTYLTDANTSYHWSSSPEDAEMVSTGSSLTISPLETTTYYLRLTQGCEAIDSVTITIASPMKFTVLSDTLCGSIEFTANSSVVDPVFSWQLSSSSSSTESSSFMVDNTTSATGSIIVTATSENACPAHSQEINYIIPSLEIIIKGSQDVCPGGTTQLEIQTTGNEEESYFTYQWYKDEVLLSGETTTTIDASPGNYRTVVNSRYCTVQQEHQVREGRGELNGSVTVNGEELITTPRNYGSCGEELNIIADYITTGTAGFSWSSNPPDPTLSGLTGNSLTVRPTVDTEYYVEFENECQAYDTIRIYMKPKADLSVSVTHECNKTILTGNTTIENPVYTWIVDGEESTTTGNRIEILPNESASAEVETFVTSADYCISDTVETHVTIDTLAVEISSPAAVCKGAEVELRATIETSVQETAQYQWYQRDAETTQAYQFITGAHSDEYTNPSQEKSTQYRVTVSVGSCSISADTIVAILNPERNGTITADAGIVSVVAGTKTHRVCGESSVILSANHTSTNEGSFVWTSDPEDLSISSAGGKEITIQPTVHTKYIVKYENQCLLSDTIKVEVHPLKAVPDWSGFTGIYCTGENVVARLSVDGYINGESGHYIRWYKDGVEIESNRNQMELHLIGSTPEDSGVYSYEVSNGICTLPLPGEENSFELKIKPYAGVTLLEDYQVIRGKDLLIEPLSVTPVDATLVWESGSQSITGSSLSLPNVMEDRQWKVTASHADYCSSEENTYVEVEGQLSLTLTTDKNTLCVGETVSLSVDTTGTGRLLDPTSYRLAWEIKDSGGGYIEFPHEGLVYEVTPQQTTHYRVTAIYDPENPALEQIFKSGEIKVEVYAPATFDVVYPEKVCEGSQVEIEIMNLEPSDATVMWYPDGSINSVDLNSLSIEATPPYLPGGKEYRFKIEQNGRCSQEEQLKIEVELPGEYILPEEAALCEGHSLDLHIEAPTGMTFRWREQGKDSLLGVSSHQIVSPRQSTYYEVDLQKGICPAVKELIYVEVYPLPHILEIENPQLREIVIHVDPFSGQAPYEYRMDNGNYGSSPIFTASSYGNHRYTVRDAHGCMDEQSYVLEVPDINPPLYFTPGEDGINNVWEVPGLSESYPGSTVLIFDRFGKKLVELNSDNSSWDGTYLGRDMPSADYWYEIDVPEIDRTFVGHFTLIRK